MPVIYVNMQYVMYLQTGDGSAPSSAPQHATVSIPLETLTCLLMGCSSL